MNKPRVPILRGLTIQLLMVTILPLTVLLLVIAFGSVSLHQRDMRALVGERDERAVQAAAAALESELHHRASNIMNLVELAELSRERNIIYAGEDLAAGFDGGLAYLNLSGELITSTSRSGPWNLLATNRIALASDPSSEPVFSSAFFDPESNRFFVVVSQVIPSLDIIVAGAFSPEALASKTLSTSYPVTTHVTIFLVEPSNQILFGSGPLVELGIHADHPGVAEALAGESGTTYLKQGDTEHVVAYSPVAPTDWALITEEEWEMVSGPSLQLTQMAPLVIVPAFVLALVALWFVATRIVQPLQNLESKAAALAWGDFETLKQPVGGISEIQHLQMELSEMARKVQAAQEGLHDYIGAITYAQEEERTRLARELHDDTIQAVIALKQRVQLAQKLVNDTNGKQSLQELEMLAEQTVENLRRLTRAFRPIYLEDLGLVTALEMLARETSQSNPLTVNFQKIGNERRLSREVELSLYRIAQEALSNVIKHSKATHADLKIAYETSQIQMEIRDNGSGFTVPKSPTEFAPNGHFGLLGIHERADLIGAHLEIESAPEKGTQLKIVLND